MDVVLNPNPRTCTYLVCRNSLMPVSTLWSGWLSCSSFACCQTSQLNGQHCCFKFRRSPRRISIRIPANQTEECRGLPEPLQENAWIMWPFLFPFFPVKYSLISPYFKAVYSELLKALSSKPQLNKSGRQVVKYYNKIDHDRFNPPSIQFIIYIDSAILRDPFEAKFP